MVGQCIYNILQRVLGYKSRLNLCDEKVVFKWILSEKKRNLNCNGGRLPEFKLKVKRNNVVTRSTI